MQIVYLILAFLVGAFADSYIKPYLSKKAERLATHEDAKEILEEVKAATRATKDIEGKISHEYWDRQKKWESPLQVVL